MAKVSYKRWWVVVLCVILGSILGVFLQRFQATERLFRNIIDVGFDMRNLDLIFIDLGFRLYIRANLGSLIGGTFGVLVVR
ncbi:MAG: hypothetical protein WBJ42_05485 [Thermovirgaceae bacterium]|nr:hypothetical protein [Synergistales bacterium]HRS48112.1 hypothetical protein [Thermovirgaceae bacterium]HRU91222.1 hypothetical protein [Thermovirgaceae bacterium]